MTLDAQSSLDEVHASYRDNADYDVVGDVAKARTFVVAVRHLLLLVPASASQGGESISVSMETLEAQLAEAKSWLARNDASSTIPSRGWVRHADLRNSRR